MVEKNTAISEFNEELYQDILHEADEKNTHTGYVFYDQYTELLEDKGEVLEAPHCFYTNRTGSIRVDGYCGDPIDYKVTSDPDEPLTLGLIIQDFHEGDDVVTLTQTEMENQLKKPLRFIESCLKPKFRDALEPSNPAYQLADLIAMRWPKIAAIRLILITNKVLSKRIDGVKARRLEGRTVTCSVWDINRFYINSGKTKEREVLKIDFANSKKLHPLKALEASAEDAVTPVYLAAVPGETLARIYDRWKERLLEQNVRVFLQARSNVNKGIKRTLENEPDLFFSFNNGITATAESAETEIGENGLEITALENLQIVNGAQTTASIYAAFLAHRDLSQVYVQMKLSLVHPEDAIDLVPRISEYANSQNKVTAADLFSNHPFHTRMEQFSRHIFAPAKDGALKQTKWFYERARGQYNDQQAYMTKSERNEFRSLYPKNQLFSKTDLAKYIMAWSDRPYFVSRGAQKNFAEFAKIIAEKWQANDSIFNEHYYKNLIAKKIVFDTTERIIPSRPWYEAGGYRAQHVALTISILSNGAQELGKRVNFNYIWQHQCISAAMYNAIEKAADAAHEVLEHPGFGYRNTSEWAKTPKSWEQAKKIKIDWSPEWIAELISKEQETELAKYSAKEQKEINIIDFQKKIIAVGAEFWKNVYEWLIQEREGSEKERGCVLRASQARMGFLPSDRQTMVLSKLMSRIEKEGCPYRLA